MKTVEEARPLARTMVSIGQRVGLRTEALLTDMEAPLGRAVGNALEIRESVDALKGEGPPDLQAICVALAARMLHLGGGAPTLAAAEQRVHEAFRSGAALERFRAVVERQGGDPRVVDDPRRLPHARRIELIEAARSGFVREIRADGVGLASVVLGAGRDRADEEVDPAAGVWLRVARGDGVEAGDVLAELHAGRNGDVEYARRLVGSAVIIGDAPPPPVVPVLAVES
jgi:pyrimidine-nucleoside phosphorylase